MKTIQPNEIEEIQKIAKAAPKPLMLLLAQLPELRTVSEKSIRFVLSLYPEVPAFMPLVLYVEKDPDKLAVFASTFEKYFQEHIRTEKYNISGKYEIVISDKYGDWALDLGNIPDLTNEKHWRETLGRISLIHTLPNEQI